MLALIVVKVGGVASDMPSIVVAGAGALTAAVIAAAILWPVDWPELDTVRGFVRRHVGVAAARE